MVMEYHPQECLCAGSRRYVDGEEEVYEFYIRLKVNRHQRLSGRLLDYLYKRPVTHRRIIDQDEYQIDDTGWGDMPSFLRVRLSVRAQNHSRVLSRTARARISAGVEGGADFCSPGRKAALRQFLILGASCTLPSVFWREGTG